MTLHRVGADPRRVLTDEELKRAKWVKRRLEASRWLGVALDDPMVGRLLFARWLVRGGKLGER